MYPDLATRCGQMSRSGNMFLHDSILKPHLPDYRIGQNPATTLGVPPPIGVFHQRANLGLVEIDSYQDLLLWLRPTRAQRVIAFRSVALVDDELDGRDVFLANGIESVADAD